MIRLAALAVCAFSAVTLADPEVKIDCPAGMHFVKDKGCVANVGPKVACPGGTHFEGGKCVAIIDTSCPAGMHFVTGTGCVAGGKAAPKKTAEAPPPPPPERPEAEPTEKKKKKGGTFSSGFSDRLQASCGGLEVEVHGGPRLTGVRAMLLVDDRKVGDEQDVNVGQTKTITGKVGKQDVALLIQQGLWGTRYTLKVDGTECRLSK
ncbi:MAG: hypothetical protein Q8K32_01180 [Archangium sp.]|nr:hypothetical protein [Archangium sp.]